MSTKSVATKLLIRPGAEVWASDSRRIDLVQPLPEGVRFVASIEQATIAIVFADDRATLRQTLDERKEHLTDPDVLWIAYPKGNRTDINRDSLWPILTEYGMRPITQIAIDDVWSALRFRPLKEGEAPFTGGRS